MRLSLTASLVLHLLLAVSVRKPPGAAGSTSPPDGDVVFEPVATEVGHTPRVVVVGPRPSGRGHARAGNDPRHAGFPFQATRPRWARGRSDGPGGEGAADAPAPAPTPVVADDTPPASPEPAGPDPLLVALAAAPAEVADVPPRPPGAPSVDADRALDDLVTNDGAGTLPRILHSSGHAGFDGCALRYVHAMRFAPGVDADGRPLDVWIHLHVALTTAAR